MECGVDWLNRWVESGEVRALALRAGESGGAAAQGSRGSSTSLLTGALAVQTRRPVLMVVAHLDEADDALDDLEIFDVAGRRLTAQRFGALEVLPGESGVSLELLAERLGVVSQIAEGTLPDVLVAPIQALMQSVPEPGAVGMFSLTLRAGDALPQSELVAWLSTSGYTRQDAVEQPGDFAVRGGIVDIYPPAGAIGEGRSDAEGITPIRVDYFGDEIDTINRIELDTMASGAKLTSVRILGAKVDQVQSDERTTSLLELLPDTTLVVLHELLELSEQARGYYERLTNPRGIYPPRTVLEKLQNRPHVRVHQYGNRAELNAVEMPFEQLPPLSTEAKHAVAEVAELAMHDDNRVIVLCRLPAERDRLIELIAEHAPAARERVTTQVAYLHRGFVWKDDCGGGGARSVYLIPHHEMFHRFDLPGSRRRIRRVSAGGGSTQAVDAFLDLEVGDYVVHVDHGVAKFTGIKQMRRNDAPGVAQEYLTLEFADRALLHVPATQIDLVQKYIGGFEGKPPLSHLGGTRWKRQKEQVAQAVKDLAAELLRVQAARATMPGIRFPGDTAWMREFEAEFPYDETEDQLAAIAAIKDDMQQDRPMDRLVCGDVGFGKTEVAIRAAFKAVEFGKQVAVLVPTTVLAEQHERTFRSRMSEYPFTVASLSRFKTAAEQTKVLGQVAAGRVDVVIGTHRLLSKDVKFADLGLVIVDEEQRFGVEHKNKLLEFRLTADVLTLTATPIPRTLHMSMIGLRDISSLSTAPADRRAVVTEVIPYNEHRIKQALIRELNREGQAYFVHNRVHNIRSVADDIRRLVPDARIVVGHGQMPPRELEAVMLKFMRHEADILVSTTIIESGIDIPSANTMFINQADHFGLADLHQLRGRVGRYKHRAYCYLLLPPDRPVTDHAAKRLRAIEQYSMLGAGFKIAMRDLEIRGAGNLLGAEQSGHIAAVGYEMYCVMLETEAKRLRREPIIDASKTHLELPVVGLLPKKYVPSDKHRMDAYRRVARSNSLDELQGVVHDLKDAYGDPPPQARMLIDLAEIRIAASTLGIDVIKLEGPDLIFKTGRPASLEHVFRGVPGRISILDDQTLYYRPPPAYLEPISTLLAVLRKMLVRPVRERASA
jgi:transcription-repair coupling factor (superfamily II helicase)